MIKLKAKLCWFNINVNGISHSFCKLNVTQKFSLQGSHDFFFFFCYLNLINYFVEMLVVFDLLFALNLHPAVWRLALMENPIICFSVTHLKL